MGVAFGGCAAQQVAEAMAVLIGVRAWMQHWLDLKPRLAVKSDSIAALVLLADMKSKSPSMNFVGRELALTLSEAAVRPQICAHIPGIANKLADLLSRKFQPGEISSVPAVLRHVPEESIPMRTREWFQTLARQAAASSR